MGLACPSSSGNGKPTASKKVQSPGLGNYLSYSSDKTFASLYAREFIQEYNKHRSDILDTKPEENKSDEKSKSQDSSSGSEEDERAVATYNPFSALKLSQ